jgi:inner membrane protein
MRTLRRQGVRLCLLPDTNLSRSCKTSFVPVAHGRVRDLYIAGIAGFGHVAVGLVSGRLHADRTGRRPLWILLSYVAVAQFPDIDVAWVSLGVRDVGLAGHRGLTHTPLFALFVGLMAGWLFRAPLRERLQRGWGVALVMASHGVLDALAQEGRGIYFLFPFSMERIKFAWQPIPDAPTGLAFFSRTGMHHLAIELMLFLPFTLFALWPRRRRRAPATGAVVAAP